MATIPSGRAGCAGKIEDLPIRSGDKPGGKDLVQGEKPRLQEPRPMHRGPRRFVLEKVVFRASDREITRRQREDDDRPDRQQEPPVA